MDDASTGTFDMNSWQGLTKVLKAGRNANMNAETYASFRDSVLRYAQSGGTDTELRTKIEEMLPEFEDIVEETSSKKEVAPPANLPTGDAVPNFRNPVHAEEKEVPKKQAQVEEKKPEPVKENAPEPEPIQEEKFVPPPAHTTPEGPLMSADEAKERIAEIKHAVTEYIGNPVTLVSENETVGRAYMKSLLAALKAVSGNAPGTLRASMQSLEEAYTQVLKIKVGQPKAQPIVEKEPEEKKPELVKENAPEPSKEPKPAPVIEREHTISSLDERIAAARQKAAQITQEKIAAPVGKEKKPEPVKENAPEPQKEPKPVQESVSQKKVGVVFSESEIEKDIEQVVENTEQRKPFTTPDMNGTDSTDVPKGVTDDLYTPEIEEGIAQLLKEWRIFRGEKKLFGRGAAGIEHPLFLKLKDMIMFDVIAGHFEGAQKDVVLSIRDYANAWRNEQGIVYSPSETFDHYLRRVIRRIIKRST